MPAAGQWTKQMSVLVSTTITTCLRHISSSYRHLRPLFQLVRPYEKQLWDLGWLEDDYAHVDPIMALQTVLPCWIVHGCFGYEWLILRVLLVKQTLGTWAPWATFPREALSLDLGPHVSALARLLLCLAASKARRTSCQLSGTSGSTSGTSPNWVRRIDT